MNHISIYTNAEKDRGFSGALAVIKALSPMAETLMDVSCENALREALGGDAVKNVRFLPEDALLREAEAMIVLGGDGTILKAARKCSPARVPLLGVNLGRVGYMAEIELSELHLLRRLVDDDYKLERRMMLDVSISGKGNLFALNDAVIGSNIPFKMVEMELFCDDRLANHYRSDGLIAATPTGSTAYSLSAGGPVVDPCMDAITVTPVCAHSLRSAPVVFSAASVLEVKNVSARNEELCVCLDGSEKLSLPIGESVRLTRSELYCGFIRLKDGGFYNVLRKKMNDSV